MTTARGRSLERGLWPKLVAFHAVALVVGVAGYLAVQWRSFDRDFDEANANLATELALAAVEGRVSALPLRAELEIDYDIRRVDGARIASSIAASSGDATGLTIPGSRRFILTTTPDGRPRHDVTVVVATSDGPVVVRLIRNGAQWRDLLDWAIDELLSEVAPIFAPLLCATALSAMVIVRSGLRPLRAMSAEADQLGRAEVGARLDVDAAPTEAAGLARGINSALDRLEQAYRRQKQFAADAAHELRTPLAVLRLRLEASGALSLAVRSDVDRMSRMIDQLLQLAVLDAGRGGSFGRVDLVAVAQRVIADIAPIAIAAGKDIALTATLDAPVWIDGDPVSLGDALRNLIDNALRFSPSGGLVEIEVDADGALRVADRGPGVSAEDKSRIFERFWRGADRANPGAGLGLAIVMEAAASHHGSAAVIDRPGGGAIFTIRLPLSGSVQVSRA